MRDFELTRKTGETDIAVKINLDGKGSYDVKTGVGFLDHMLELFAKHGGFDLFVRCKGDTQVDAHHTVEDVAIVLGSAIKSAAGDCLGINRYGDIILPMDDALILCAIDFGGRAYLGFDADMPSARVGDFDSELCEEFMYAFCRSAAINLHIKKLDGRNTHHIIEGIFKALARALKKALTIDQNNKDALPSTKGVL